MPASSSRPSISAWIFLNHLFAVSPCLRNHFFEHAVAIGVEGFKTQLFELDFDIMNT